MGGIGEFRCQSPRPGIELRPPALGGLAGKDKLSPTDIAYLFRCRFAPKGLKKPLQIQFPSQGILRPMDKGGISTGIIRFPQKSQPKEILGRWISGRHAPEYRVHIGGVIKRVALGEYRPVRKGFIPRRQMV